MIVSEHGHVLAELELPAAPTQPLVVSDFNGDGLNDIIVVTNKGLYGYVQVRASTPNCSNDARHQVPEHGQRWV